MPIFEYRCEDCGGEFEDLVPHAERDEPQECPCCGGKKSKRLMSRFCRCGAPGGRRLMLGRGLSRRFPAASPDGRTPSGYPTRHVVYLPSE